MIAMTEETCWCCEQTVDVPAEMNIRTCPQCGVRWMANSTFIDEVSDELHAARDRNLSFLASSYGVSEGFVDHAHTDLPSPA